MSTLSSLMRSSAGVVAYDAFATSLAQSFGDVAVSALNSACGGDTDAGIDVIVGGNNRACTFTASDGSSYVIRANLRAMSLSAASGLQENLTANYTKLEYDAVVVCSQPPEPLRANDKYFVFVVTPNFGTDMTRLLLASSPHKQRRIVAQLQCFFAELPVLLSDVKAGNILRRRVRHEESFTVCDFDEAYALECALAHEQALFFLVTSYFSGTAIPAVQSGILETMRNLYYGEHVGPSSPSNARFPDGRLVGRLAKHSSLVSSYRVALDMAVKDTKLRRYFHDYWYFLLTYLLETVKAQEKAKAESKPYKATPLPAEFTSVASFLNEKASSDARRTRMQDITHFIRFDGTLFLPFAVQHRIDFAHAAMTFIFHIGFALSKSARSACDEYTDNKYGEKNKWHSPPSRDEGWSDPAVYNQSGISLYSLRRSVERIHSVLTSDSYRRDSHDRTDARLYSSYKP